MQAAKQGVRRFAHPDRDLYDQVEGGIGSRRAALSTARKIARRAVHVLAALDPAA